MATKEPMIIHFLQYFNTRFDIFDFNIMFAQPFCHPKYIFWIFYSIEFKIYGSFVAWGLSRKYVHVTWFTLKNMHLIVTWGEGVPKIELVTCTYFLDSPLFVLFYCRTARLFPFGPNKRLYLKHFINWSINKNTLKLILPLMTINNIWYNKYLI